MKDLFVLTADADALALIGAVLSRPDDLGIRPITFDADRHTGRDPGMVRDGPELIRMQAAKTAFECVMLVWDHQGSGWEAKSSSAARDQVRLRLDQVSWKDRSEAVVIVPELEEWIWHDPVAVATQLGITERGLQGSLETFARRTRRDVGACLSRSPKKAFEHALYLVSRRKPLMRDFEKIGLAADLGRWLASESFARFATTLREWFPC